MSDAQTTRASAIERRQREVAGQDADSAGPHGEAVGHGGDADVTPRAESWLPPWV
jgi:hypothetical protein